MYGTAMKVMEIHILIIQTHDAREGKLCTRQRWHSLIYLCNNNNHNWNYSYEKCENIYICSKYNSFRFII